MKYIQYADGTLMTSDLIADSLLELVAELGRRGTSEVVHIATVDEADGSLQTIDLVIGPASQMTARPAQSGFAEPEDAGIVGVLKNLPHVSGRTIATPATGAQVVNLDDHDV